MIQPQLPVGSNGKLSWISSSAKVPPHLSKFRHISNDKADSMM
jgi:hypothetical protein